MTVMTKPGDMKDSSSSESVDNQKMNETKSYIALHGSKKPFITEYRQRSFLKRKISAERRKASSEPDDPWGWFEDFESPMHLLHETTSKNHFHQQPLMRSLSLPGPVTTPPYYVLESSLETQQLWYITAGQRPKQPEKERKYFEQLWAQNFANSNVNYDHLLTNPKTTKMNVPSSSSTNSKASTSGHSVTSTLVPTTISSSSSSTPTTINTTIINPNNQLVALITAANNTISDIIPKNEFDCEILYRGKGSFSNSVSKSFIDIAMTSITIQIPRFRIVKTKAGSVHAEFLNVVSLGNKNTVVFGIWRRHSDFLKLASKVDAEDMKSYGTFKNTILSWQCVLQRKRWFRCLDKDYLALKCFLLERFIHDLLFESQTPKLISEFLGLD